MFGRQELMFIIQEKFYKKLVTPYHIIYPEFIYPELINYLIMKYKYSESIDVLNKKYKQDLNVVVNENDKLVQKSMTKLRGNYRIYSYYVNAQQKEFIQTTLINSMNNNEILNNSFDYFFLLVQSGVRIKSYLSVPVLDLVYYKQANGIPIDNKEISIINYKKIPFVKQQQEKAIYDKLRFKSNDILKSSTFYYIGKLNINDYHIRLVE